MLCVWVCPAFGFLLATHWLQDFWKSLSSGGEVLYLSRQNDSLRHLASRSD